MITLGRVPEQLIVYLTRSDPFVMVMRRRDDGGELKAWDVPPVLEFGTVQWTATLSGSDASWAVPDTDVDAVIAANPDRAVRLTLGGIVWAAGQFVPGP